MHQIILNLINLKPNLLILGPQLIQHRPIHLNILQLLRYLLLVLLPLLLELHTRRCQLPPYIIDIVAILLARSEAPLGRTKFRTQF